MPAIVLTAEEKAAALQRAGADLKYLLDRQEIAETNQAILYHVGVTSIEKFANLARDKDDLVEVLKTHLGLDREASLEKRVEVAAFVCAHTNAQTRVAKPAEVEAEYDSREWTKPVVASEWMAMKSALEKRLGVMEDKLCPAKEYLEKKLSEVENAELRAESLTEVVSKDEVEPDSLMPVWDSKGNITVRKGSCGIV